jgi:membrane-associated phospholipid phosphatase
MFGRQLYAGALAALVSALAATAAPPGPYELGKADWLWVPAALGLGLTGEILYQGMNPVDTARLDRNRDLWVFDRWDAGARSRLADLSSTGLQAALLAAPMAVAGWEGWHGREAWDGVCAEAVVYSEALAVSAGLNLWVRSFRVHPRPLVYDPQAPASDRLSGEASGSFYSGHASASFLSATYFAYTWSLKHPGESENVWIWTGGLAAAGGVAALRVVAGKHYPSDVVVGATIGAGLGLLFPWLHQRPEYKAGRLGIGLGPEAMPMLSWKF